MTSFRENVFILIIFDGLVFLTCGTYHIDNHETSHQLNLNYLLINMGRKRKLPKNYVPRQWSSSSSESEYDIPLSIPLSKRLRLSYDSSDSNEGAEQDAFTRGQNNPGAGVPDVQHDGSVPRAGNVPRAGSVPRAGTVPRAGSVPGTPDDQLQNDSLQQLPDIPFVSSVTEHETDEDEDEDVEFYDCEGDNNQEEDEDPDPDPDLEEVDFNFHEEHDGTDSNNESQGTINANKNTYIYIYVKP